MKQLILLASILSLLFCGAWGCSENPDKSAGTVEIKGADDVQTAQTGMVKATEEAKEKAKKAIEEMQATTPGASQETKGPD